VHIEDRSSVVLYVDAAVALSVLVLGFSFVIILTARFFTRKREERAG
jgi:ABC-type sulfate transport system permease component